MSVAYRTEMEPIPQYDLSRLPENTALKQQTLPAHQLELSASVVLSFLPQEGSASVWASSFYCLQRAPRKLRFVMSHMFNFQSFSVWDYKWEQSL